MPPGIYTLEFSSATYKPVLCQVQVNPRSRSRVTFGGQNCRVELNDYVSLSLWDKGRGEGRPA